MLQSVMVGKKTSDNGVVVDSMLVKIVESRYYKSKRTQLSLGVRVEILLLLIWHAWLGQGGWKFFFVFDINSLHCLLQLLTIFGFPAKFSGHRHILQNNFILQLPKNTLFKFDIWLIRPNFSSISYNQFHTTNSLSIILRQASNRC